MARQDTSRDTPSSADLQRLALQIHLCQRVLQVLTGVMIGAFILILLFTTFSTGPFVQVTGRGLYFVILVSALVSLGFWIARLLLEKRAGGDASMLRELLPRL